MKKSTLNLLAISVLSLGLFSCTLDTSDGEVTSAQTTTNNATNVLQGDVITGTFTQNILIRKGNYTLNGIVKVNPGVTVTFEAGSTITANSSVSSAFVVLKGAKVMMEGTAAEPIVWTSNTKIPGDWGGISIYGEAPILALGGATTAVSEDGLALSYGGTNPTDNSGILKFVRVEFAGKKLGDGSSEFNGFTFYSVGSGTVLENLVSYKGTDDGYEFFGGTVSASNLISYGNYDDSFDWQDGWAGQSNFNWFAYQTGTANFGMEVEASNNIINTPPKVNGITLIRAANTNPEVAGSIEISAIQFKKHGTGIFSNVYMQGYKNTGGKNAYSVLIQDVATYDSQLLLNKIKVTPANYVQSDNDGVFGYSGQAASPRPTVNYTNDTTVTKTAFGAGNWAKVGNLDLLAPLN